MSDKSLIETVHLVLSGPDLQHSDRYAAESEANERRDYIVKQFGAKAAVVKQEVDHSFKVGDEATFRVYTDAHAGYIVAVSKSGKRVTFQAGNQKLLNGSGSGEPDALTFTPGGFIGHTEGKQRWSVEADPDGQKTVFTYRGNGVWKQVGHRTGSPGCSLKRGHHPYYDFNF